LWKYDCAGTSTTPDDADAAAIGLPKSVQRVIAGGGGGGGCWLLYPWNVDVDADVAAATVAGKRFIWLAANSL